MVQVELSTFYKQWLLCLLVQVLLQGFDCCAAVAVGIAKGVRVYHFEGVWCLVLQCCAGGIWCAQKDLNVTTLRGGDEACVPCLETRSLSHRQTQAAMRSHSVSQSLRG